MNKQASSPPSQQKTPSKVISTIKAPSSKLAEQTLNAWVDANATALLEAIKNWKRAEINPGMYPGTVARFLAEERTSKDLRYNLRLIGKDFGPLHMHYKGCDGLARHWVCGWETDIEARPVVKIILRVDMGEILPGQSPALERLDLGRLARTQVIQAQLEEEGELVESEEESEKQNTDDEVWSTETAENEKVWSLENSADEDEEKHKDKAKWVKVPSGGADEGDWMKTNRVPTVVKDAGRFLLEAARKT